MINLWTKRWKIKINENKSTHVTFTLRKSVCTPVSFNNILIPSSDEVKYQGLIFNKHLNWSLHLKQKRKSMNSKLHLLRPLLKSKLSLPNKLTIYKSIIPPAWLYGIQLCGTAKPSNTKTLQAFQSISLRLITAAPWYVTNKNLHKDQNIPTLNDLAKSYYSKFHSKLCTHLNPIIQNISTTSIIPRTLKRQWPRDLLNA